MPAPRTIRRLIARFSKQFEPGEAHTDTETSVRRAFIEPFFTSLGWDVANEQGLPEHVREVVHEPRFRAGNRVRAPDYLFRIGGTPQFFVAATTPCADLRGKPEPAIQLRRYAWSANLPFSVLTNFRELAVYDCRKAPKHNDIASKGRLLYFTCKQYEREWDRIAELLAQPSVRDGSFARLGTDKKPLRGSIPVEDAFLAEIESWRASLARNLATRTPKLGAVELNAAVQKIIDRITFLRICEDRGIENIGRHSPPDTLTPTLELDDATLHTIFEQLYPPRCPFVFSAMPAAILGQVYERFLGRVITLDKNHNACITDKPEVRKAGGVYYTPGDVVNFMVSSVLGPLLAQKTPQQVANLHILDPACGSGSFLLGIYQFLLDWHLGYYLQDTDKHTRGKHPRIYQVGRCEWRLTTDEKKRILLNNVFGVDIDPQAVEVAKLSLLLKVLEGETEETIGQNLKLFKQRALPDLGGNIQCGNTLIDDDFFKGEFGTVGRGETINPFAWHTAFPATFTRRNPGFDAVVGNPPYVDSEWMTSARPATRSYCTTKYEAASGNWDMYCVFIDRSLQLLRDNGLHSFIVPNKLASADYAAVARRRLASDNRLLLLRDYSQISVFPVSVYPLVYLVEKRRKRQKNPTSVRYEKMGLDQGRTVVTVERELDYHAGFAHPERTWAIFQPSRGGLGIAAILEKWPALERRARVLGGATVAEAYELLPLLSNKQQPAKRDLRVLNSGTIDPFTPLWGTRPMRYLKHSFAHPVVVAANQSKLPTKRRQQARTPKLIVAGMTRILECVADTDGTYLAAKSTTIIIPDESIDLAYLAAVVNSRLMTYLFRSMFGGLSLQGGYLRVGPPQLKKLPIRVVEPGDTSGCACVRNIQHWVSQLLQTEARLLGARVPHEREKLTRRVNGLRTQIDVEICTLYGLNDTETKAVLAVESA